MFQIKEGTPADKIGEGTPPEVLTSITAFLEKTGYAVRTNDQEKAFLQTHTQNEINKVMGERNTQFEATILETTGIPKTQGEKFHEYHKRAIGEKLKEVTTLQDELKTLKEKGLSGSDLAQQYKRDLEAARGQIATLNTEWEKKVKEKDNEVFTTKVSNDIEKLILKVRAGIDPTIKPELHDDILSSRMAKFYKENTPASLDGVTIWKGPDGITRTGKKDGKPSNTEELFLPYFADIMPPKRGQAGAGSGDGGAGGGGTPAKWKEIQLPETVKTQVGLTDFLLKTAKLDPTTKEYSEAFENLKGNLPLK